MKKVFILAIAVLAFAACKNNGKDTADGAADSLKVETVYDIAYIHMDSLVNNYNRFVDLSSEFESKATKAQNDLEARARRLQNEMMDFQEKVQKGLVTRSQAAELQESLERKSQNFEVQRQNKLQELAEEEQVMTNQVMHAISEYVAKFNADYRFKMVLTTSGGTPIINADPALDITQKILTGLNDEYKTEQAEAGAKK